jgi:hypothetical protein
MNYNPAAVVNGGLIDFQDARALAEQQQQQQFFNNAHAIANMNAYTMQQSMMNPLGNPTNLGAQYMYNGVTPQMMPQMMGAQVGFLPPNPSFMPTTASTASATAPPPVIFQHGQIYKKFEEPTPASLGSEAVTASKPLETELKKHVDQKVAEFMSKDGSVGCAVPAAVGKVGSSVSGDSTQDLFLKEIRKLNQAMKKQSGKR